MKRIISWLLCLAAIASFPSTIALAYEEEYEDGSSGLTTTVGEISSDYDAEIVTPFPADYDGPAHVDLTSSSDAAGISGISTVSDSDGQSLQQLDFSRAVNITDEMGLNQGNSGEIPSADNLPPVANPQLLILNPESMRDDQYTTDSLFFLVTKYQNQDFCYDPEGGPISLLLRRSSPADFPLGYINKFSDASVGLEGYAIEIFNTGSYLLDFAFEDSAGAASPFQQVVFDIASRAAIETIEGSLRSSSSQNQHNITVDYSLTSRYVLGILRTGKSGFTVTVTDADGNTVGSKRLSGPDYQQNVSNNLVLSKPAGVTGKYTYTVTVSTTSSEYVGNLRYQLAYGMEADRFYLFEDVSNSMDLPYYHTYRNSQQNLAYFSSFTPTSDHGHYYKITATGTEILTLRSNYGQYRFKILGGDELETLYDGRNLEAVQPKELNSYYTWIELGFEAGKTYYVVVYDPNNTDDRGSYSIMVGDHHVVPASATLEIGSRSVTSGNTYSYNFEMPSPTGAKMYVDTVHYSVNDMGWGANFEVFTPGAPGWRSGSRMLNFNYDDETIPTVRADGQWSFRFTASRTGLYPGAKVTVKYWYEL